MKKIATTILFLYFGFFTDISYAIVFSGLESTQTYTAAKTYQSSVTMNGYIQIGNQAGDPVQVHATTWTFYNASTFSVNSNINFDDNTLRIDGTNNSVGIGTPNPASALSVFNGDIRISTNTGSRGIIFQDGTVQLTSATTAGSGWSDDGTVVRLLTAGDNVGIGQATAGTKLHVEGAAAFGSGANVSTFSTVGALTLTTPLVVGSGGSGASSLTDGGVLFGNGTGAVGATGVLSNGQLLIGDGTEEPTAAALTGTSNQITVTNGAGSITLSTPQNIHAAANPTFSSTTITGNLFTVGTSTFVVNSGSATVNGQMHISSSVVMDARALPAVSASNQGKLVFDVADNVFKVSENGASFRPIVDPPGNWTCTIRISTTTGSSGDASTSVLCTGTEKALSGGCSLSGATTVLDSSWLINSPSTTTSQGWSCQFQGDGTDTPQIKALANCCQ